MRVCAKIRGMKRFVLLLALLLPCAANVHNLATITGTGATVQISTDITTRATWIQVIAPSSNSAVVYFGDSTVTATRGLPIAAGGGYNTPPCSSCVYTLAAHYAYIANGDKINVAFGN